MKHNFQPLPISLQVTTISGNSGVYIGHYNVVFGLSRHSKSNSGFGSIGSHNAVFRNVNIVYDPDVIDTPIDDRDVHIYAPVHTHAPGQQVTNVGFDTINVATITQNSGIFVGDVTITGLDSHEKENVGSGTVYGNQNVEFENINCVYDSDVIDTPINDQDMKAGVFITR